MLSGGLGPTGVLRYDRDILGQRGVRWAIIFEGVNDIGGVSSAGGATTTANNLIAAYKQMNVKAHNNNIRIYGATILPFNGNAYYNQYSELCRSTVNQWIRTKGNYDACIDFDEAMRNPQDTTRLVSTFQNDGLHPDAAGYTTMGGSIDLNLFTGPDTVTLGVISPSAIRGYFLGQNYPNPFNPATVLPFNLPVRSFVSLKVFDSLGRKVATIVSEELPAGDYSRRWNAANMSSGVYYYRLQASSFVETKKLLLVR